LGGRRRALKLGTYYPSNLIIVWRIRLAEVGSGKRALSGISSRPWSTLDHLII
jgi:hypothetical protein